MFTSALILFLSMVSMAAFFYAGNYYLNYALLRKKLNYIRPPSSQYIDRAKNESRSVIFQKNFQKFAADRLKRPAFATKSDRQRLRSAGVYSPFIHYYLKLIKSALALFSFLFSAAVIAIFLPTLSPAIKTVIFIFSIIFGYVLLDLIFAAKAKSRHNEAHRFFSDLMQLLIISLSAGLSLEASLRRVSAQIKRQSLVLHQELEILLAELSLRGDRSTAFAHFGDRLNSEYFRNLSVIMQQTEKQGVSSVEALRTLAATQTEYRFSMIEAKVARLGVLMTLPLIIFIFPLLFGVIIVPSVLL